MSGFFGDIKTEGNKLVYEKNGVKLVFDTSSHTLYMETSGCSKLRGHF
jgi:hypothetical protein